MTGAPQSCQLRPLDPLAEEILRKLAAQPAAADVVLGGYLALSRYAPYRDTHDIDAWWRTRASSAAIESIRAVMLDVASRHGCELKERSFGETLSLELHRAGTKRLSFQIAVRSVALEEPVASEWPPIAVETLHDNIGSKMNALVHRGAPRDLLDIKRVVEGGLVSTEVCWDLWARKNPGETVEAAKTKVLRHVAALDARRPLDGIPDLAERQAAAETRAWFRDEFLRR